jgi:group II intron reverse transcriptase/maturase/CRISPR-associated endonuclease Cas1
MKSLFDQIRSTEVLTEAWQTVRKKNAKGGIDGINPPDFDATISKTIQKLSRTLSEEKYVPTPYEQIKIPKFNDANEWRPLSLPVVEDKIVQQAAVNVMMPVFEKEFLDCSYAYRRKKSATKAIRRVEHIIATRKINWIVSHDIDNFFDTMSHHLLIKKISKTVKDPSLLSLIRLWLRSGLIGPKGDYKDADAGIAQGAVISPLLSNIYLNSLDRFAVSRHYPYVRYSDNFIGLFPEKRKAAEYSQEIIKFIKNRLSLALNENKTPVQSLQTGFVFLGIFFKGKERKISREKERKTCKHLNWLTGYSPGMDLDGAIKKINTHVLSQKRYYTHIKPIRQFAVFDTLLLKRVKKLLICQTGKGNRKSRQEYVDFIMNISRYEEKSHDDKKKDCEQIADEIINKMKSAVKKSRINSPRSVRPDKNTRRVNTRTNKYLREVANVSEVVVTSPGVFIGKTGKRLVLRQARKNVCEHPFARIRQITVAANGVAFSSDVIRSCADMNVNMTFINHYGKPVAMLQTPESIMGELSLLQLRMVESEKALKLASRILNGKCRNQMNLIKFYTRHRSKTDPIFHEQAMGSLEKMKIGLQEINAPKLNGSFEKSREKLFLNEARVSGYYWYIIKNLLPPELGFTKREKRKAGDVVNNMLNYGYGVLYQRIWNAAIMANLNPNISFLHAIRKKKPTLIYDLIEEFRQSLVDRPIFSMMTKGRRYEKFKIDPRTGLLDKKTKEITLSAVLSRLSSLIGYRGRKVRAEDIIYFQADNMAKYIAGRKKIYKPFISTY